jgi:tetratricopeptide (TPR) repeat protein
MALIEPDLQHWPPFQHCLAVLRAGDLEAAEALGRELLQVRPGSADLWHLLGVLALRQGRPADALAPLDHALGLAPDTVTIIADRALAAERLGRLDQALADLDRLLALQADHAGAWVVRGRILRAQDRPADSLDSFERALTYQPALPEALHGRSHALAALGRATEALGGYDQALRASPGMVDAWLGKGNVLLTLKEAEQALTCFDRALTLIETSPSGQSSVQTHAHALCFRADALRVLGRHDEALAGIDRALELLPDDADAWIGRGRILLEMRAFEDALTCYDHALRWRPDDAKAHDHRSRALREIGRYEESLRSSEKSLQLKPDDSGALNSRANSLRMLGRVAEALEVYPRAIAAADAAGPLRFNHAVCLLVSGDFERGWPEYEYRWTLESMSRRKPRFHQPVWLGKEPVAGRRILLHAEQGLGDTIQFCRYAPMVAALGATVILGVQSELRALLISLEGVTEVVDRSDAPPVFEAYCPLLSLPLAFRTTLATVPARVPYLAVPDGHLANWRGRLGARRAPRIGLVWSGNKDHMNDHHRSLPLVLLAPLGALGFELHCLQRDLRPDDVPSFALAGRIAFHGPDLLDFADTAALIVQMDVVITVDTSVAHLAGALGRPVWLLLPFAPDWRWMLERNDSPWYPTMRLFRQPAPHDWGTVIDDVMAALASFPEAPPGPG